MSIRDKVTVVAKEPSMKELRRLQQYLHDFPWKSNDGKYKDPALKYVHALRLFVIENANGEK